MTATLPDHPPTATPTAQPTVWGLTPTQLHDRYWAARGVQVVRQGEPSEIVEDAELFLLTPSWALVSFKLGRLVDYMSWIKPDVMFVRLRDGRDKGYQERALVGPDGKFIRFQRIYGGHDWRQLRVALTPDPRLARLWQKAADPIAGWQLLRSETTRGRRAVQASGGNIYDRTDDNEVAAFMRHLVQIWKRPDSTVLRAKRSGGGAWRDPSAKVPDESKLIGPVWVGAGREVPAGTTIIGPRVLWDDPAARPPVDTLQWQEIEPTVIPAAPAKPRQHTALAVFGKRLFDIVFALVAILLTLPLYPFVMLAIWLEDGRPFFFVHKRETRGGREFGCIKFRSMRKDADQIKAQLQKENKADGPQFFIENDPRMTRVGDFLRKTNIDELPQFFNVLLGHMSVVGPRPSPYSENQYCPPWREARLSVRPGITGLWQVRRTRRQGLDFQEWIKYDIEYVENASWLLDLRIIWETVRLIIRGVIRP